MQDASSTPSAPLVEPREAREPRQRWRLVVGRTADAPSQTQRELADAWEGALLAAGLPVARGNDARARPRISFGAPLPAGMAAEGELIDVVLTERWPLWRLREAVGPVVPPGWRLVEAQDVWLAGPALAGRVAAADHLVTLDLSAEFAGRLRAAAAALLAAGRLERRRRKGDTDVPYDLRPLLLDVAVVDGPPLAVRTRTRIHPELGTGRPEEVVGALSDFLGEALPVESIVRERLVLIEDLERRPGAPVASQSAH